MKINMILNKLMVVYVGGSGGMLIQGVVPEEVRQACARKCMGRCLRLQVVT